MVGDIDGDGRMDFAITNRRRGNAAIWMQNTRQGWKPHIIDPGPPNIEAGGVLFDVDGDSHLDMIAGGDSSANEVWWWQNPHPDYSKTLETAPDQAVRPQTTPRYVSWRSRK
jgi:hypothetical protein